MKSKNLIFISHNCFVEIAEYHTFTRFAGLIHCKIVRTKDHILRRNCYCTTVNRLEQVVSRKHKESCFCLSFSRKRYVNRHLVTVEVRVKRRTYKGVKLDCTSLNEHGLERLNRKAVECRCTVEHYGVFLDYIFKGIPYLGIHICFINLFLCFLYVSCLLHFCKALNNEGLEQFKSHFLRKTTLINLKIRTYNDNGTTGIVNTFTEQVLTETSLLTSKHFRKGLESTVRGTCYRLTSSTIINKRVNRFLKHTLFVSDNDFRSTNLHELLKTVITADNSTIELVKVGRCKSTTVKLYHGTDVGRKHGNNVKNHPFKLVA